jgi:hypothetical protein
MEADGKGKNTTRHFRGVVVAVSLALVFYGVCVTWDYYIDDVFIHLQYARNVAQGRGFVFSEGEKPSYGVTSPLWVWVLAAVQPAGIRHPELPSKAIGWAASFVNLLLLAAISRRLLGWLGRSPWWTLLALTIWGTNPGVVRWQNAGMETPLFITLVLVILLLHRPLSKQTWWRTIVMGLVMGALFLLRPEGMFLCAAYALVALWAVLAGPRRMRVFWMATVTGLCWIAVALPWLIYSRVVFGTIVPNTVLAKGVVMGIASRPQYLLGLGKVILQVALVESLLIALGALVWFRKGFPRTGRLKEHREEVALWIAFIVVFAMAYYLCSGYVLSRYYVVLMPCVLLVAVLALDQIFPVGLSRRRVAMWLTTLVALVLAWGVGVTVTVLIPHVRGCEVGNERLKDLALEARAVAHPGDAVVICDIGIFAYYSGLRVIDLVGLVTREVVSLDGAKEDYLLKRRPRFAMLHSHQGAEFTEAYGSCLHELSRVHYPVDTLLGRRGEDYVLSEVDWKQVDEIRAHTAP